MIFTSISFVAFLTTVLLVYWCLPSRRLQNCFLLLSSYFFYGFIHPWFCLLIAASTLVDFHCGKWISNSTKPNRLALFTSILFNLGMLSTFKYYNFFIENITELLSSIGMTPSMQTMSIILPVGISFYTFQTLSYTIDLYRKKIEPCENFIDFALFVSFFPQLVAGPIERAKRFLPQITADRIWCRRYLFDATHLILRGYVKKLVIADNVAVYVDKIFMLDEPSYLLLIIGSTAFAVQILSDFSAYTDIARGCAKLLGFNLVENFRAPYLAVSPSDFWRRWHISFSTWIRDYLYIPLGGSRSQNKYKFFLILAVTMGMSGLWHGASWNFVAWGLYHGLLVFIYHQLNLGGKWEPQGTALRALSVITMFLLTIVGWSIFRSNDLSWLFRALTNIQLIPDPATLTVAITIGLFVSFYSSIYFVLFMIEKLCEDANKYQYIFYAVAILLLFILSAEGGQDFIYFQF